MRKAKRVNQHTDNWTMSNERAFMENLLCSRFNFLLIFFALVIGGALNTQDVFYFRIVLTIGAIITLLVTLTIARAQSKLNVALDKCLYKKKASG